METICCFKLPATSAIAKRFLFRFALWNLIYEKRKKAVKSESFHLHRKLPNSLKNTAAASSHSIVRVKETKEKKLEKEIRKKLTVSSMVISGKKKWRKRPEKELQQLIFNSSPLFFQPFASARLEEKKKRLLTSPRYAWFFPRSIHFTRNPPNGYTQQKQTQEEGKTVFKMLLKVFFEVSRCPDVMTEWHFLIVPVCLPRLQNGNLCESSSNRDRFPQARRGRAVEKPRDYHIQQFIKIVNLFRLEKKYFFSGLQRLRFGIIETEVFYKKNLQQKILQRKKFFFYFLLPFLLEDFFQTLIQNKRSEATHKKHLFPAYSWPRPHWLFYACRM